MAQKSKLALPIVLVVLAALAAVGVYGVLQLARSTPNDAKASTTAAPATLSASARAMQEADALIAAQKPEEAATVLTRAVEADTRNQDLRVALGRAFIGQKKFAAALEQYEAAIKLGFDSPEFRMEVGTVANSAGKPDVAATHYSVASSKRPDDYQAAFYLASMQSKLNRLTDAKVSLLRVVKLNPNLAEAWGLLADVELRDGNPGIALQHIAKARAIQPDALMWRIVEARALKRANKPAEAEAVLVGLAWEDQRKPEILTLLCESLGMQGKAADAAALATRAAKDEPKNAELQYQAALWCQRAGDNAAAKKFAKAASDLNHPGAKDLLAAIGE